jgi:hypothetical protein
MLFRSHGVDLFTIDLVDKVGIPERCIGCHADNGLGSILSYSRAGFPLPEQEKPMLFEGDEHDFVTDVEEFGETSLRELMTLGPR